MILSNTFFIKQRPDNCLISICTSDSKLNFMKCLFVYVKWISWTLLDIDLTVETQCDCWRQASSLTNSSRTFKTFIMLVSWRKLHKQVLVSLQISLIMFAFWVNLYEILRPLLQSFRFRNFMSSFINNRTQRPTTHCTSHLYYKYDNSQRLTFSLSESSNYPSTNITLSTHLNTPFFVSFTLSLFLWIKF
jgi:hypothetical protein